MTETIIDNCVINEATEWFIKADSNKDSHDVQNLSAQFGAHFEEFGELVKALDKLIGDRSLNKLTKLAEAVDEIKDEFYKGKYNECMQGLFCPIHNDETADIAEEIVDAFGDQIFTATGCLKRMLLDPKEVVHRVNASNFTKFDEDGNPIYNDDGKVIKGKQYVKVTFEDLVR